MTKKNSLSIFSGSQGHMYAVLLLVWENYKKHLKDFQKKNTKYTEELAATQEAAIKAARDLPDAATRREPSREALAAVAAAARDCANNWQDIPGYIEKAFDEKDWLLKKQAAGYANYEAAANRRWDKVIDLNNAATTFLTDNADTLTTKGGMPADFPARYGEGAARYASLYDALYITRFNGKEETGEKEAANYSVYTTAASMMADAKKIYRYVPRTRAAFTYDTLMKSVRGEGFTKTGVTFTVITLGEEGAKLPVTGATATFSTGTPCFANEKGHIRCLLPEGTHSYTITAPGMVSIMGSITIHGGTAHQRRLTLKKSAPLSAIA